MTEVRLVIFAERILSLVISGGGGSKIMGSEGLNVNPLFSRVKF